jgi:hypothetical protein
LFSRVLQERFSAGVRAGLIATAATTGVLVAYGLRSGSVTAPFLFLGRHLGGFRDGVYLPGTVMLAGFLLHAAWVIAWCVVCVLLAGGTRPLARALAVVITVTLAYHSSSTLIGTALISSGLAGPRWFFLHIVFAVALYKGTRLAPLQH